MKRSGQIGSVRRVLAMAFLALSVRAAVAGAEPGGVYLSWGAPYGLPRAGHAVTVTCDDTSRVDSLFLSFEVPKATRAVVAYEATLYFTPPPGDTLGEFWFFKTGWPNGGNMIVDVNVSIDFPCRAPWNGDGRIQLAYDHRSGRGRLDISYSLPEIAAMGLDPGIRYCFARVALRHRRIDLAGCAQPVCVEWSDMRLRFASGKETDLPHAGNPRVGWNALPGAICEAPWKSHATQPWRPKPSGGSTR